MDLFNIGGDPTHVREYDYVTKSIPARRSVRLTTHQTTATRSATNQPHTDGASRQPAAWHESEQPGASTLTAS